MPDVLDIVVAGGGPFGTAVAFRARELGLKALVIDYDDLMKRIRDYAKDKLILPDYGGGDQMQFPKGGEMVSRLRFGPIDKDDLCAAWKALYTEFEVPYKVGVELTGIERQDDAWNVITWNHVAGHEERHLARHVVLALGRGVPRRIDVPGDLQGLAFSLRDATAYVGAPACVIGGGTSAAEAVVAISAAKAAAQDPSLVFWSYRGDKMPKVSRALADVFFEAFVGRGNIRYLPNSDPVSVVGDGSDACLAIRTNRVVTEHQPVECTQLEFLIRQVIACIGEDIPTALLTKIGVPLIAGGPSNKSRLTVTPLLETAQPDVYLAGDTLSPVYFEADDFANPTGFRELRRRGNIKAALRDGVFLAEVISQKLAGQTEIRVSLEFDSDEPAAAQAVAAPAAPAPAPAAPSPAAPAPAPRSASVPAARDSSAPGTIAGGGAPPASPSPRPARPSTSVLVAVLPSGTEANEYALAASGTTVIGRQGADVQVIDDPLLSDRHAAVVGEQGAYAVRDEGSTRGTYLQLAPGRLCRVPQGGLVKIGSAWLRVGDRTNPASLTHYTQRGELKQRHQLEEGVTIVGRESPDITLDAGDQTLSRRHCAFVRKGAEVSVKDLGSANGTVLKVTGLTPLVDGDRLLVGQQVFRFVDDNATSRPKDRVEFDSSAGISRSVVAARAAAASSGTGARAGAPSSPEPAAGPGGAAAPGGPSITIESTGQQIPCPAGKTVLEALKAAGVAIEADCKSGACGVDAIKVCQGAEHLSPVTSTEADTLDTFNLAPGTYRYACVTRVNGPVVIDVVGDKL